MKKKMLLVLTLVFVLICVLAISASAEVTTYDDAPERTNYLCIPDEIIEFYDGFKCPVSYVFTDTSSIGSGDYDTRFSYYMDFTYINGKLGKTEEDGNLYTYADVKGFDIPSGITHVAKYAGKDGTTLKWITFPDTIKTLANAIFQNATALEECTLKFSENNAMRRFPSYMFFGCKSLKAFSMPDNFTSIYDVAHFSGCTKLGAVHLSESLETWSSGGGALRTASFDDCNNMYFVNEAFTYDNIPEKPEIYYFPANLSSITDNSVCRECKNLNDVLVFGTQLTTMPNAYFFQNGPANKIVFLGDMTTVSTQYWGKTTQIFFANPADNSLDDVTYSGGRTTVFCNAEGNTTHLSDPRKTTISDPTCVTNQSETTYCFCTKLISTSEVENTAFGHNHDLSNGATLLDIVYADYSTVGYKLVKCSRCDDENDEQIANAIIYGYTGYSTKIGGNGITFGYSIDKDALAELKSLDNELQLGFVVVAEPLLGNQLPLDEEANPVALTRGNVIKTDVLKYETVSKIDFVLKGDIWDSMIDLDSDTVAETYVKDIEFIMCGYVYAKGAVQYIGANGATDTLPSESYSNLN